MVVTKKNRFAENHARAHILVSQQLNSTFLNLNEMATFSYELADSDIIGHPIRKNTSDSNSNWTSREDFEDLYDSGSSHEFLYEQDQDYDKVVICSPEDALPQPELSSSLTTTELIHPNHGRMKIQRRRRMTGGTVGGLVLGTGGAVLGGVVATYATNKICKNRERAAQRKLEQQTFQKAANCSMIHAGYFA